VQGIKMTLIDNGMPVVVMRATDFGRTGYEDRASLDADSELKERLEAIRLEVGPMMRLGDVREKSVPKMILVAPPRAGGSISTRSFIPHRAHASVGVFAALSVATAALLPGTPAASVAAVPEGAIKRMGVEHPSGMLNLVMEPAPGGNSGALKSASVVSTARKLFEGIVYPR
jgi:4-oxalomesaconate tautomerase